MDKKIKILRIIARLNIGGPAIHTILLSEGLDKGRFETILVTGRPEESEGDMAYLAEEKGLRPIIIPELGRALNIRKDIIAFWKLFCLIKREQPDIIHTHTAKAGTLGRLAGLLHNVSQLAGWPVGRLKKRTPLQAKLVHTFHGHVLHSYFGRIRSRLFIWIEKLLAVFTHKIIAVSKNLRQELIVLKVTSPKKIVTIPLGLELERYLKIEKDGGSLKEYQSIGIISRLVPVKNHKMFLDVVKRLKQTFNLKQRMKFLIIGDGPLRRELENYTERLGIAADVNFTGWVEDLSKIYSQLDIVVLTSLNEGTPVALIEAQAASCPCVATWVGGVSDVVEHGRSGYLVPAGDSKGFIEGLIELLNSPQLRQTMGRYGREKVRGRFNKERLVRDIETLYKKEIL